MQGNKGATGRMGEPGKYQQKYCNSKSSLLNIKGKPGINIWKVNNTLKNETSKLLSTDQLLFSFIYFKQH